MEKNEQKLPVRQVALRALVDNGMSIKDASMHLGYTYGSARQLISKNNHKLLTKLRFSEDKSSQKIAHKTIKSLAAGQVPEDSAIENVKDSTALEASRYIHSYLEPVKSNDSIGGQTLNFTQINVNWDYINSKEPIEVPPVEVVQPAMKSITHDMVYEDKNTKMVVVDNKDCK